MTHPFERILLATEHTEFDSGAERIALQLVKLCGLPLSAVIPVSSNPEYEAIAPQIAARAEQEAAAKIYDLRAIAQATGVEINIAARRGQEPFREIVQEAVERASDLIVLRRRGKPGFLSNLLVGEMVTKVVAHAPCSTLFVPRAAQIWSHGVLAAVDTSPFAGHVASVAAKVASQCNLPLYIVSVLAHDTSANRAATEEALSYARAAAEAAGMAAPGSSMLTGKPHEQILAAAKNLNADLVVVGRHGESNLIRTPFGGTTQKVIGLADTPVMVVRA
ncbi:MAG TPA: universal stress protein [Gallionellaceae bacterium]